MDKTLDLPALRRASKSYELRRKEGKLAIVGPPSKWPSSKKGEFKEVLKLYAPENMGVIQLLYNIGKFYEHPPAEEQQRQRYKEQLAKAFEKQFGMPMSRDNWALMEKKHSQSMKEYFYGKPEPPQRCRTQAVEADDISLPRGRGREGIAAVSPQGHLHPGHRGRIGSAAQVVVNRLPLDRPTSPCTRSTWRIPACRSAREKPGRATRARARRG